MCKTDHVKVDYQTIFKTEMPFYVMSFKQH